MKYRATPFGKAVFDEIGRRMKIAEHKETLDKLFDKPETP